PIQGDMVHPYLRRRQGLEKVSFPSKELEDVLGKTLGVPLFQEQAMRIAIVAAGFTPQEADRLRRAMATFRKVGIIHEFGMRLVDGMLANGYARDFAERCFKQIEGFGEYGFPESHAASFALIVYVSAWLKHHWPEVFLAAILNAQPMGFYSSSQLVRDAKEHGVIVLPPDVSFSDWDNVLEPLPQSAQGAGGRKAVRLGLREIKGFKEADAARIVAAREAGVYRKCTLSSPATAGEVGAKRSEGASADKNTPSVGFADSSPVGRGSQKALMPLPCDEAGAGFVDIEDLKRRARLNARAMELLSDADAMGSLKLNRRTALWQAKGLAEAPLPLFAAASQEGGSEYGPEVDPALPEMALSEQVVHDYARLRLSLKGHPVAFFREELAARRFTTAMGLQSATNGGRVDVAGLVLVRQKPGTAKGVLFVTLEDETGSANVIVWPKIFDRFRRETLAAKFMWVRGRLQRDGAIIHVIADQIVDLNHRLPELSDGVRNFPSSTGRADEIAHPRTTPQDLKAQNQRAKDARITQAFTNSRDFH
ncbi:MAG: hypothetical protein RL186_1824, partial [Pseudomonadota bacterium]